jgi:hypothetical protein
MALRAEIVPVAELTPDHQDDMIRLLQVYFAGVSRERFAADLAEKSWAVLLLDEPTGAVRGFSTLRILSATIEGVSASAFYSGDTIIDRACWGATALEKSWIRFVFSRVDREPARPWFWFLVCKGYRTYRYLPVYFRHYYPSPERTPPFAQAALHAFASQRFGAAYNPDDGTIYFPDDYTLRPGVGDITERELRDPRIDFFERHNPRWRAGAELACIAELSAANLKPIVLRWLDKVPVA